MADDRLVEDPDLDAVLGQLMAVEPSPGFLPRVRERIAHDRPERSVGIRWLIGACSTAALVAVAGTLWLSPREVSSPRQLTVLSPTPREPVVLEPPRGHPIARQASHPSAPRLPRTAPPAAAAAPAVIVDERQRSALALLLRMVGDGTLTREAFERTTVPSEAPIREQVPPIGVEPVAVSPMAVGGVLSPEPDRN